MRAVGAVAGREVQAYANLPVSEAAQAKTRSLVASEQVGKPFIVAHPGGGVNPGARFDAKRFPPRQLAETLNRAAERPGASVILLGGPGDGDLVAEVARQLTAPAVSWVDRLTFPQIGALAADALVYIGNDSGLTHLAAASGATTVMLMGPTDPRRYAPYARDAIAVRVQGKQVEAWSAAQIDPREWQAISLSVVRAVEAVVGG